MILKINRPDGTFIQEKVAKNTFIRFIEEVGAERICNDGSFSKFIYKEPKPERRTVKVDGYYVETQYSLDAFISMANKIANKLAPGYRAEKIEGGTKRVAPKKLSVSFKDGTVISQDKALWYFFVCVLDHIGAERVEKLGLKHGPRMLINRFGPEDYNDAEQSRKEIGHSGLFAITHLGSVAVKSYIQKISDALNLGVSIVYLE